MKRRVWRKCSFYHTNPKKEMNKNAFNVYWQSTPPSHKWLALIFFLPHKITVTLLTHTLKYKREKMVDVTWKIINRY